MRRVLTVVAIFSLGCGSTPPPPAANPAPGTGQPISGLERIGWDQQARDAEEIATLGYALYVDGIRHEIADALCTPVTGSEEFACTGSLPPTGNGPHTLELASFRTSGGEAVESPRSPPLRVVVAAASMPPVEWEWRSGPIDSTRDGVRLQIDRLSHGLDRPADGAFGPDGRLFIAERSGRIRILVNGERQEPDALTPGDDDDGGLEYEALSMAIDPAFERSRFIYVARAAETAAGSEIQLARYREAAGRLGERAILYESVVAGSGLSATVRFGPDGKIYLLMGAAESPGRLLRLNADGARPRDQAGATTAIATGLTGVRGMAWDPRSALLWIGEETGQRGRLSALALSSPPVRAILRGQLDLPAGMTSLVFYHGGLFPAMERDALVASAEGYILRLRFADAKPARLTYSERPSGRACRSDPGGGDRPRRRGLFLHRHGDRTVDWRGGGGGGPCGLAAMSGGARRHRRQTGRQCRHA